MTDHEPLTDAELQAIGGVRAQPHYNLGQYEGFANRSIDRLLAEVRRLKRANDRLWAENVKLSAGWASVDTTKLADITDLDECKRRLQRERERSHGAIRELNERANTPNPELAKLRAVADAARRVRFWSEDTQDPLSPEKCRDAEYDLDEALAALKGDTDDS